tara:strand:+ start:158 stop:1402 length:1245 start_codon:yes stop_codon:yes gene_type:complete
MSSLFTYQPAERKVKGFAGRESAAPLYLQFVTGYCIEVCSSEEIIQHKSSNHTNSIMARPHQSSTPYRTEASSVSEDDRHYPLFRTSHDVPSKGDPVLLTTFNGVNYYLGPMNMPTNNPTWNNDEIRSSEIRIPNTGQQSSERAQTGESSNFNKEELFSRLIKKRKSELDYGTNILDTTGDYIIEGRHGNSLRIGSRSDNPYLFISNARDYESDEESLSDGTIISITSDGTLAQHFGNTNFDSNEEPIAFKLASDVTDTPFPIGDIYSNLNGDADIQELIYGYDGNQILFQSDRLTLNSQLDDIFISSKKDIHIGGSLNITLSAGRELDLISSTVTIGNPYRGSETQPMVLGNELVNVLESMMELFKTLQINTGQMGLQSFEMSPTWTKSLKKYDEISKKIKLIRSNFHEIEGN